MPSGWPLGLGIMSIRLRVVESLTAAAVETHSLHMPLTSPSSMSSFSSSNLDTQVIDLTASFNGFCQNFSFRYVYGSSKRIAALLIRVIFSTLLQTRLSFLLKVNNDSSANLITLVKTI